MAILLSIFKTARPRQWVKNLALFAPLIFSGFLFREGYFMLVSEAFLSFVCLSSATYFFNDLVDVKADLKHPIKKNRPIASGKLPKWIAVIVLMLLVVMGINLAAKINLYLLVSAIGYLALQVLYSFYLKHVPIIDVLTIASGYLLRVYAGSFVISAHMDVWFLLTVISVSLFLAIGKRRGELTTSTSETRATLKRYTESLLDVYTAMFSTATWITYSLFTFNHPRIVPDGRALSFISILPRTLISEKWLMLTIPLVVYGLMRYLQLIYEKNEGESPEKILLSDIPLMSTVIIWVLLTVGIIYYIA